MSKNNQEAAKDVVDDVRALRAEVSRETSGFEHMAEFFRQVHEEYANRTGRFAELGRQISNTVQKALDALPDHESVTSHLSTHNHNAVNG